MANNIIPQVTSTNINTNYLFSLFVPTANITQRGKSVALLDVFNPNIINGINAIKITNVAPYIGGHITTVAYKKYNTTTPYWMILLSTGIIYPINLNQGLLLNFPSIDNIKTAINRSSASTARNVTRVII